MKQRKLLTVLTTIVMLAAIPQAIAAFTVSGRATDRSGDPLTWAIVRTTPSGAAVQVDADGRYSLKLSGDVTLEASASGYTTASRRLAVTSDTVCDFVLTEDAVALADVSVLGKSQARRLAEGALSLNAVEIRADVNRLTSLNDIVDRTAGVKVRREGGAGSDLDLSINGLSGNSIRYFIDGVPLDSKGSQVNLDNIPVNMVERVELYKGVVPSSLSSDALGGAVNIITKRKRENFVDASYGFGSFHTHSADLNSQLMVPQTPVAVRLSAGYTTSKNDYTMRDVEIWSDEEDKFVLADLKRFHDDYTSALVQLEAGVNDVRWADAFFVSGSYTDIRKDIQTGAMQNKVYGMAERKAHAWNIAARYAKQWGPVGTRFNLSHTDDFSQTVDTAFRKYSWDGSWRPATGNEMNNRARTIRNYKRPLTVLSAGADYEFLPRHTLSVNYMLNRRGNRRSDEVDTSFEPSNDVVTKHILSLTYTNAFFDDRWQNMFFVKDYINSTRIEQTDDATISGANDIEPNNTQSYWGAGVGTRFTLRSALAVKASYEHSVRLPLSRELLGNGTTVYPNLALAPEQSNNWNLGFFGTVYSSPEHLFAYELNGFIRHVQNYIRVTVSERDGMMQYVNEPAIEVKGMDFDLSYTWRDALNLRVNGSWNDARDLKEFKTDGNPSATYKNRVPNRPWLFGNAEASYTFRRLSRLDDRLRLEASFEWIHWYFLNWEAYGSLESKAKIPTQCITNFAVSYSLCDERYNLSLECNNAFNRLAYDNYKLQKPGRAFYAKFRIFIR